MGRDHIVWGNSNLKIPKENYEQALDALSKISYGHLLDTKKMTITQKIVYLLAEQDFAVITTRDFIRINGDPKDDMDVMSDRTLDTLIGIAAPGSFVTYVDDDGDYYQFRYKDNNDWDCVQGTVSFPHDDTYPFRFS